MTDAYTQVVFIIAVGVVFGLCGTAVVLVATAAFDRISQRLSKQEEVSDR